VGAKVSKGAEKMLNCIQQLKFFLPASLADYLYLHF